MNSNIEINRAVTDSLSKIQNLVNDCILIVIDVNLFSLYKDEISNIGQIPNKKILIYKAISGEKIKTLEEYEKCVTLFVKGGIHRKAHLVAIGGGAISDFGGFIASSLLRGISWSVIPTTLLSMVDASIGGKVGLNLDNGKNLIGAFHRPENIWISTSFLLTLPKAELQSGRGEILKYAFLSKEIKEFIHSRDYDFNQLIALCSNYKQEITKDDYKELGKRKILNLGHTFGHAVEKHYDLPHGNCVFFGMIIVFLIMKDQKSISELKEMVKILEFIDTETPWHNRKFPIDELMIYLKKDKKVVSIDSVDLVIMNEGLPEIIEITFDQLQQKIKDCENELQGYTL